MVKALNVLMAANIWLISDWSMDCIVDLLNFITVEYSLH